VFRHSRHTNFLICDGYHQNNISISKTNYPHHIPISKNLFDHAMIYQWQKVIGIVPAAITPEYFFSTPAMSGSQKGSWVIISEQLAPAHSWTRCLLELHVHHCLGEHHLFPRLRGGFPLIIATWRSRMVCLSLSAGIPGLELPEHEGLQYPLTKRSAPFWALLFSSRITLNV
jgi:hypothetical protein